MAKRKKSSANAGCAGSITVLIVCAVLLAVLPWIGLIASIACVIYFAVKLHGESAEQNMKPGTIAGVSISAVASVICSIAVVASLVSSGSDTEFIASTAGSMPIQSSSSGSLSSISSSSVESFSSEPQIPSSFDTSVDSEKDDLLKTLEASGDATSTESASIPSASEPQAVMVWISNKGNKYHKYASCSNMVSPWQVTLEEAQAMGRDACKRCC